MQVWGLWLCCTLTAPVTVDEAPVEAPLPESVQLERLLSRWERSSAEIERYAARGTRFVYDSIQQVETRADFSLVYEGDRLAITFRPVDVPADTRSARLNFQGDAYRVESAIFEKWQRADDRAYFFTSVPDKEGVPRNILYAVFDLPAEAANAQGSGRVVPEVEARILSLALPSILNFHFLRTDAFIASHRFELEAVNDSVVKVTATPMRPEAAPDYQRIELLFPRGDSRPQAIKILDRSISRETVFVIHEEEINPLWDGRHAELEVKLDGLE